MRTTVLALASGLALTFATAALADTDMSSLTPQPEQMAQPISAITTGDSKQVICHHLVHQGAIMPQAVCLTKQTWERMRLQTQRTVSDFQVHSYVSPTK